MNRHSIRDLLRLALPFGTSLLTHEIGLKRQVNHAVSLRATLPAFPALHGGELVLLSVREALLLDERLTLSSVIQRLGQVRVGAIGFVGAVDQAAIAAAEACEVPLLHLPEGTQLKAAERDVLFLLNNSELQLERRAAQLYSELTQQVASGAGIEAALRTVSQTTGRAVAFFDAGRALRAQWGTADAGESFADLCPRKHGTAKSNGRAVLVKAIGKAPPALGYVALGGSAFDAWDEAAAEQAAAALLLELSKQQAVQAVEARLSGELLQSIVSGTPATMITIQEQASRLGYDLRRPHVALMIAPANSSITAAAIEERLEEQLHLERIAAPHVLYDDVVLCLYPLDERKQRPKEVLRILAADVAIAAGISRPAATAAEWQRAYREAEQALALGRHLFGPRSLTPFDDLRVYQLLYEFRSSPKLWNFYHATLDALAEYDRRHQAALLQTLEAYFAAQGNLSQASERLQIHRNTLLYRLRRVSQISGLDLEHPEDTLALQIALKAHRVLAARDLSERSALPWDRDDHSALGEAEQVEDWRQR